MIRYTFLCCRRYKKWHAVWYTWNTYGKAMPCAESWARGLLARQRHYVRLNAAAEAARLEAAAAAAASKAEAEAAAAAAMAAAERVAAEEAEAARLAEEERVRLEGEAAEAARKEAWEHAWAFGLAYGLGECQRKGTAFHLRCRSAKDWCLRLRCRCRTEFRTY